MVLAAALRLDLTNNIYMLFLGYILNPHLPPFGAGPARWSLSRAATELDPRKVRGKAD